MAFIFILLVDAKQGWNRVIYYVSLCPQQAKSAVRSTSRGTEDTECVRWDESQTIVVWEILRSSGRLCNTTKSERSILTFPDDDDHKDMKDMVIRFIDESQCDGMPIYFIPLFLLQEMYMNAPMYDCNWWVMLNWSVTYHSLVDRLSDVKSMRDYRYLLKGVLWRKSHLSHLSHFET